jgi:hypothetical protein
MAKEAKQASTPSKDWGSWDGVVHWMLQGKGGVGKSTCSAFLLQYLLDRGIPVEGIDTDPVNRTFRSYQRLPVDAIEILEKEEINPRAFDLVVERVLSEKKHYVIDTGASSFIALWKYLHNSRIFPLLRGHDRRALVHTVVAAGGALMETMAGLKALAATSPERNLVVWINEHEREAERAGLKVTDMAAYQESAEKIVGTVLVPLPSAVYKQDIAQMIEGRKTFEEAIESTEFGIVPRMRLATFRDEVWANLDQVALVV